jgi:tetratricopeptide (TPR) repeat protein
VLAQIESSQGNFERARDLLQESLTVKEELGDRKGRATSLAQLGIWETAAGEYGAATSHLAEAAQVFAQLGARLELAQVRLALAPLIAQSEAVHGATMAALAAAELGRLGHPEAMGAARQAQALAEAVLAAIGEADPDRESTRAVDRGAVLFLLGRHYEALPLLQQAEQGLAAQDDRCGEARAAWFLGHCASGLGDEEQARELINRARQVARELDLELPELPTVAPLSPARQAAETLGRATLEAAEAVGQGRDPAPSLRAAVTQVLTGSDQDLADAAATVVHRVLGRDQGLVAGLPVISTLLAVVAAADGGERLVRALVSELQRLADTLRSTLAGKLEPEREAYGHFQLGHLLALLGDHGAAIAAMERSLELNTRLGNSEAAEVINAILDGLRQAAAGPDTD